MEPKFADTKKVDTERISFYAMYLNQEVLETPHLVWTGGWPPEPDYEVWAPETLTMQNLERSIEFNFPLFLNKLEDITDEHLAEAARLLNEKKYITNARLLLTYFLSGKSLGFGNLHGRYWVQTIDYLRSKGYALPWREYSVDDLIAKGWVFIGTPEVPQQK